MHKRMRQMTPQQRQQMHEGTQHRRGGH